MKIIPTLALLSLISLGGALVVTNPSEEKYAEYLAETITIETQESVCQPESLSNWLGRVGEVLSDACQGIIAGGESLSIEEIQTLIVDNTEHTNRGVFSTYVTETPTGEYRAVGALGRFFPYESETEL